MSVIVVVKVIYRTKTTDVIEICKSESEATKCLEKILANYNVDEYVIKRKSKYPGYINGFDVFTPNGWFFSGNLVYTYHAVEVWNEMVGLNPLAK